VQAAINAITDSSATKVYTVFIDAGVIEQDTSISTNPKSYINFVGRGIGASVIRASTQWFSNVQAGSTSGNFFDLSGSTNITIRGLTIDARSKDPGTITSTPNTFAGVKVNDVDRILFDGAEVQGLIYGLWENSGTGLIQVMNSKIGAVNFASVAGSAAWHIFASDLRAVRNGGESPVASGDVVALDLAFGGSVDTHTAIWGSHLHAESGDPNKSYMVAAVRAPGGSGNLDIIGSTVHLKMTTSSIGSASRSMYALFRGAAGASTTVNIVGSDLLYETPTTAINQGRVGGIGWSAGLSTPKINLVGSTIIDRGGSGGTRADLVHAPIVGGPAPTILTAGTIIKSIISTTGSLPSGIAALAETINTRKGVATITPGPGTVAVALSPPMPDANYRVAISVNANETIWVTNKLVDGFILHSSVPTSSASVDWTVSR